MRAKLAAALDQALVLDHIQRFEADARSEGVAAEGGTMAARRHQVEHFSTRHEGRHREQSATERLADDNAIRADALVHIGKPCPGTAQPGLNFVDDHQHLQFVAQCAHGTQETRWRQHDAGLALDRFDQHGAGVRRDCAAQRFDVAKIEVAESRREGTEIRTV